MFSRYEKNHPSTWIKGVIFCGLIGEGGGELSRGSAEKANKPHKFKGATKKTRPYFPLNPGWLIGILIMVYYNPYITG